MQLQRSPPPQIIVHRVVSLSAYRNQALATIFKQPTVDLRRELALPLALR